MSDRIKGTALSLAFGGTDHWADMTSIRLDNEEAPSSVTTFADAAAGGARRHFLEGSAIQSTQTSSFWRYVRANPGAIVAYRYAPHGNAVATADKPHFTGTCKVPPMPPIGGDAGEDDYTFDVRFNCQEEPVMDTGSSAAASITAITPAGRAVGQAIKLEGTRFTGATDVKFGSVSATSIVVISDTIITAVIPAGTGVKAITVITPDGTSPAVNYTVA